jgi:hypothetical protein
MDLFQSNTRNIKKNMMEHIAHISTLAIGYPMEL